MTTATTTRCPNRKCGKPTTKGRIIETAYGKRCPRCADRMHGSKRRTKEKAA